MDRSEAEAIARLATKGLGLGEPPAMPAPAAPDPVAWIEGPPTGPGTYWVNFRPGAVTADLDDIEGIEVAEVPDSRVSMLLLVGFDRQAAHADAADVTHHIRLDMPEPPRPSTRRSG